MLIRCPECQFERDINIANIPASATVATCPRCSARFRFRDPESGEAVIAQPGEPETQPADQPATQPEALREEAPAAAPERPRLPTEQEGDDPLPPGAVIPNLDDLPPVAPVKSGDAGEPGAPDLPPLAPSAKPAVPPAAPSSAPDAQKLDLSAAEEEQSPKKLLSWLPFGKDKNAEDTQLRDTPPAPSSPPSPSGPAQPDAAGKAEKREETEPLPDLSTNAGKGRNTELRMRPDDDLPDDDASPLDWRDDDRYVVPWEHPEQFGMLGSFFQTILRVMFRPQEFFRAVSRDVQVVRAAIFYAIITLFSVLATNLWSMAPLRQISESATSPEVQAAAQTSLELMSAPLLILAAPFVQLIALMVMAFFFHLMIRLVQPDRSDYNLVFKIMAYSSAPYILCIVPVLGPVVALCLYWTLCFMGCKFALNLSWSRTALALAPLYVLGFAMMVRLNSMMASMF